MNKIIEHDSYIELIAKNGDHILIDKEDYERVKQHTWNTDSRYAVATINGKKTYLHRFIMEAYTSLGASHIDHVNGKKLDDRRRNLRTCNKNENAANMKKSSGRSSKYKGVVYDRSKSKYKAEIKSNQKLHHIGYYDKEIDAALAYNKAAITYFGEFAKLNEIQYPPPGGMNISKYKDKEDRSEAPRESFSCINFL